MITNGLTPFPFLQNALKERGINFAPGPPTFVSMLEWLVTSTGVKPGKLVLEQVFDLDKPV
jgi:hypothetical protein